jgi:hypothetical protein
METNPAKNDARKARRRRKLKGAEACALCGEEDLATLVDPDKCKRSMLNVHHVAGKASSDDLTVTLCRNCHAKQTEAHRDVGLDASRPETLLHQLVSILRGLGQFLMAAGEVLLQIALEIGSRLREGEPLDSVWEKVADL